MQEYRVKGNGVVSQNPGQCEEGGMVGFEFEIHPWDGTDVVAVYLEDEDLRIGYMAIDGIQELIRPGVDPIHEDISHRSSSSCRSLIPTV